MRKGSDFMDISIGSLRTESPMHEHKYAEIIVCTEGEGFLKTTDDCFYLKKGDVIIIPPKTVHSSVSEKGFERIFIGGSFDWILNIKSPVVIPDNTVNDGLLLAKMIYRDRYKNHEYLSSLINAFVSYVLQLIEIDSKTDLAVNAIINEITERFFDCNINLSEILCKRLLRSAFNALI